MKRFVLPACLSVLALATLFTLFLLQNPDGGAGEEGKGKKPGAAGSFEWWYAQRALPFDTIPSNAYQHAYRQLTTAVRKGAIRRDVASGSGAWRSLGPTNVGGRVLSLAVDPVDRDILWAGSASGGLWKSTTRAAGSNAWSYVNTGHPIISVSSIVIDPTNRNTMFIGTGELSLYRRALIGTVGARASYGMGVLKSTDRGATWTQTSLTWEFSQITAVHKIALNPLNPNTVFAATSEGTFRSTNSGSTWHQSSFVLMAMDVVINPVDTSIVYMACGNYNSASGVIGQGIYKSTNAGTTWAQLGGGLPASDVGRTSLAISPSHPDIIYAGISKDNGSSLLGLYKTVNGGTSWSLMSTQNYVGGQGWYNNVVMVHPTNPDTLYCGGIDIYKSTNGGGIMAKQSNWTRGSLGVVTPGGEEGTTDYVHADQHAIAFDPGNPRQMYFGGDGGVFESTDGGDTFRGRNGGFVTTQFYPGFANSTTDSTIALGGLQDNGVLKYIGSGAWRKVDGADGGWCAIDPSDNNIIYGEYTYLAISRSTDGGSAWKSIRTGLPGASSTNANFLAPFVLSPSHPNILFAGAKNVYITTNRGDQWLSTNGAAQLNGTNVSCIGVSATSYDTLMAGTGTGQLYSSPKFEVFASTNHGQVWTKVSAGLPDRYPTDIAFDPANSATAYITYSGFGTPHVFKTTNLGASWTNISGNLPDIPHQAVVADTESVRTLYVGNDLGVFRSTDEGSTWEEFGDGMPLTMVLDLTISPANYALRASTFGNGVYERSLPRKRALALLSPNGGEGWVSGQTQTIAWSQRYVNNVLLEYSSDNGSTWSTIISGLPGTSGSFAWSLPAVTSMEVRVRISDAADNTLVDSSDAPFTIFNNPDLTPGWNIISLPYAVADPRRITLFPNATSEAYSFRDGYEQSDSLETGLGYWLKVGIPQNFSFTGDAQESDTIDVVAGWNLIGSISSALSINQLTSIPEGILTGNYFGFKGTYVLTDSIRPKAGYWAKSNGDGKIILSAVGKGKQARIPTSVGDNFSLALTFTNESGLPQKLFLASGEGLNEHADFELPPAPPSGVFDARFGSNRFLEELPGEFSGLLQYPVRIQGGGKSIEVRWENRLANTKLVLRKEDGSETLISDGVGSTLLAINEAQDLFLRIEKSPESLLPPAFALYQNYPNPFNPLTHLQFTIYDLRFVSLKLYDMLGEEVAELVGKEMAPGSYTIQWDASGQPSGVYLARLVAGGYSESRKMLLMR